MHERMSRLKLLYEYHIKPGTGLPNKIFMSVKAKFRCNQIIDTAYTTDYSQRKVVFSAVYGKEGENADYAKATPSGNLEMVIDKETKAYDAFQPGKEYYLMFEEAPAQ